ncbi:MAG: hypothetical protein OXN18_10135 [Gemmatimonadota bacterium]|nr:hypothetical protein [Gemmatimonadota bacterium]
MARLKRARVVSGTLLVVVAAAGFLGGLAWQAGRTDSGPSEQRESRDDRGREERRLVIDEVGLTPAKRAEVEEIIQHFTVRMRALDEEFRAAYQPIREAYEPRRRDLFRATRDSIKAILLPEERALYDSLLVIRFGDRDRDRDSSAEERRDERPERNGDC